MQDLLVNGIQSTSEHASCEAKSDKTILPAEPNVDSHNKLMLAGGVGLTLSLALVAVLKTSSKLDGIDPQGQQGQQGPPGPVSSGCHAAVVDAARCFKSAVQTACVIRCRPEIATTLCACTVELEQPSFNISDPITTGSDCAAGTITPQKPDKYIVGIFFSVLGCIANVFGMNLVRRAHADTAELRQATGSLEHKGVAAGQAPRSRG